MHRTESFPVLLTTIDAVCTISASAEEVIRPTHAGDVNLSALVNAVLKTPALVAKLLRLANSPLFGQTRKVHDIERAVVIFLALLVGVLVAVTLLWQWGYDRSLSMGGSYFVGTCAHLSRKARYPIIVPLGLRASPPAPTPFRAKHLLSRMHLHGADVDSPGQRKHILNIPGIELR